MAKKKSKPIYQQKDTYYCTKCERYHRYYSGIGKAHWKYMK